MNRDRVLKVAGIQMAATGERARDRTKAGMLIELAAAEEAKIISLPQLFGLRWFPRAIDDSCFSLAEKEDGETVTMCRERAERHAVVVIAPIFEEDGGEYYNTAFVIGPDGGIIGKYRKMHVPQLPLWEEKAYFSPGNLGFPVFDTPFARIGVQLCWDVFFPEGFRILALKGAEVVFAPTASAFEHSQRKWERAICASAHANGLFVMRVNRVGKEEKQTFYGRSFCARPDGEFVERPSGSSEGVVLADIELGEVSDTRNEWVFLKDRRPAQYKEIVE